MKLLGKNLSDTDLVRFDIWNDLTKTRIIMAGFETLMMCLIAGVAMTIPTFVIAEILITGLTLLIMSYMMFVVVSYRFQITGLKPIRTDFLLCVGNRAIDWPFGKASIAWTGLTIFQSIMMGYVFFEAEWFAAMVIFLVTMAMDQYVIWQKAVLTRMALES